MKSWKAEIDFFGTLKKALGIAFVLWLAWGALLVLGFAWFWKWITCLLPEGVGLQELGQTGDLFGGVNALFAAFAFAGVGIAAYYQYRSWELQRDQTTETVKQTNHAAEQTKFARKEHVQQSFEPLFFKLLERFDEGPSKALRAAIDEFYGAVLTKTLERKAEIAQSYPNGYPHEKMKAPDLFIAPFLGVYLQRSELFGPYYRSLYQVFKFIANSSLPPKQKLLYANIARATLSDREVFLLALNCLTRDGKDFVRYVDGFGLLKHLREQEKSLVEHFYERTAFMSSRRRKAYWDEHGGGPEFLQGVSNESDV